MASQHQKHNTTVTETASANVMQIVTSNAVTDTTAPTEDGYTGNRDQELGMAKAPSNLDKQVAKGKKLTLSVTGREVFQPLDGGWGWAVVFGCFLFHICLSGIHKR